MSLEQVIAENTAAVKELTAALAKAYSMPSATSTAEKVKEVAKEKDTKKDTSKSESTAATASSPKDATPAASEKPDNAKGDKPSAEETEALYQSIKQPFLDLVAKDKPKAVQILDAIGAKALKAADYDQLVKAKELLGVKDEAEEDLA